MTSAGLLVEPATARVLSHEDLAQGLPPLLAVDWPELARRVVAASPRGAQDAAEHQPHVLFDRAHVELACCAVSLGKDGVVDVAAPLAAGDVAEWLFWTSWTVLGRVAATGAPVRIAALPDPLYVDGTLPQLPLLDLAAEHAANTGRPLVVVAADLPASLGGRHRTGVRVDVDGHPQPVTANVIEIRQTIPVWSWQAEVFAHELAHELDPDPWRTEQDRERFAVALADLLQEHPPTALDGLPPLIEAADRKPCTTSTVPAPPPGPVHPQDAPPAPAAAALPTGGHALLTFAYLPLTTD